SGFNLPDENLLNLFDSDQSADEIDDEVGQFIENHTLKRKSNNTVSDIIIYFIGHGFLPIGDSDYYLAIRRTREENLEASSIKIENLARTLKQRARFLRRILILDCC